MGTKDAQNHGSRRQSTATSALSHSQTGQRTFDNGRPEAYLSMENNLKAKRTRHRNNGAQQFKQHSSELQHGNGEVPDDPIYDELSNHEVESKKPHSTLQIQLPGFQPNGHKVNANRASQPQEERQSNTQRPRIPVHSGPLVSEHFVKPRRSSLSKDSTREKGQTLASGGARLSDDGVDPLNEDFYQADSTRKQTPVDEVVDVQELSSDDDSEMKGHIPPSKLKSSRLLAKEGERVFTVTKAFCETRKWLFENSDVHWTLRYHGTNKTLILQNINQDTVWNLRTDKLNKIDHNPDSPKLIFHKSADATDSIGMHVHLELRNVAQSEALRGFLKSAHSTIGCQIRDFEYLTKAFDRTIQQMQTGEKKKRKSREIPAEDIGRIDENKRRRQQDKFANALSAKRLQAPVPGRAQKGDATAQKSGVVNSMRTRSGGMPQEATRPDNKLRALQPRGEFYSTARNAMEAPPSKRVSARASEKVIAPRRSPTPPPQPERWSHQPQNTSWQNDWKSSLIFPPDGKNKATVDKQDIERLDEGEFLNDNLLVFYLRKLEFDLQTKNPDLAKRVYFQNPFFYERLTTNAPRGKKINYEAVQRWTAKVDLFKYDYIVVPVNENVHWYVAIICNVNKFFKLVSSDPDAPSPDLLQIDRLATKDDHVDRIVSPTRVSKKLEGMSLMDKTPRTNKSRDCNDKSNEAALETPIESVSKHEDDTYSVDNILNPETEEAPIVSDLSPVQALESSTVSTARQQKKKIAAARHVNTDSLRIITLDSLGTPRSGTCTNLKNYLLAEIKAKTGRDVDDPGRVGHTARQIPEQTNYYDCGLFLLMYVEMFLEKGDDFIKDLITGREDVDLVWPAASELRANIRQILFGLQEKQVDENARLRDLKRKEKEARSGKTGTKSDVVKKSKSAAPPRVSPEQPALPEKTTPNTSSKKISQLEVRDSNTISLVDKIEASATDTIYPAEPAVGSTADKGNSPTSEGIQGVPSLQPRSSIAKLQDIGSRFVKSMGWGASQNQNETHQVEEQAQISEKIVGKTMELQPAPKNTASDKKQEQTSSSTIYEVPDSPDLVGRDYAPRQETEIHEELPSKGKARLHSPELESIPDRHPREGSRLVPDLHRQEGSHNPYDVDGNKEPATAALSKPTSNDAAGTNHEQDDLDDVMLLDTQESVQSSNGPNNPQLLDSSPERTTKHEKNPKSTQHPNSHSPVRTHRNQAPSPQNRSANDRTSPPKSSTPKKRKAISEVDKERELRQHNRPFRALDGADQAIIGTERPIISKERPMVGNYGHFGGKHTKFGSSP